VISEPVEWHQQETDDYRLRWRFAEDDEAAWQVSVDADLICQINEYLGASPESKELKAKLAEYIEDSPLGALYAPA